MPWRRTIKLFLFLFIIVAIIGYGFMPKPIAVDMATVTRDHLQVILETEGKTRVIDRFVVSSPIAGFLQRIPLKVGDSVKAGQVITQLEPLPARTLDSRSRAQAEAQVSSAQAALQVAQENVQATAADADYAALEVQRLKRLQQSGSVAKDTLDQAQARARRTQASRRSAEFAVKVAQFELEAARTALRYSAAEDSSVPIEKLAITAPVPGQILQLQQQSEAVVSAGQALVEIGDPHALEVEIEVLSPNAVRIKPGSRVLFERWGGDAPLEGQVRRIEPVAFTKISALGVEEQRVLIIADFVSAPEIWQRLGDRYRVEAQFILWEGNEVLQIPANALFRYENGWAVFTVVEDTVQRHRVKVGHRSGLVAEIVEGLKVGEIVVTHPSDEVGEGVRIRRR
ncbi:MAG: HlyD family efflux transporter periplasmic adaptor subunit [Thioploca sp.]|nr:HlyD family efflux transporter periplasmic adaptor subunit [Thioploca sp.]